MYPKAIKNLIESFKYFPGIGEKTAERLAFSVLALDKEQVDGLTESLINAKKNIRKCSICNNLCEGDTCEICKDKARNGELLCLVEDPKTVFSIEKLGTYNGYYHVLNGLISSFNGINPDELRLDKLIERIGKSQFKEVIIAVKQCIEGEMTALYIKNILNGLNIKVTRIASGIPMGADMEYIDSLTLEKAFDNRQLIS
jgi:recombination protein RecR